MVQQYRDVGFGMMVEVDQALFLSNTAEDDRTGYITEYTGSLEGPQEFPAVVYFYRETGYDRAGKMEVNMFDWMILPGGSW